MIMKDLDNMEMNIGNITTIATIAAGFIVPYIGTEMITQDQLVSILTALIIMTWLIFNSSNPNSLSILGNGTEEPKDEMTSDEYES